MRAAAGAFPGTTGFPGTDVYLSQGNLPLARVDIDFDGNPGDLPPDIRGGQWTDVTQWVREVSSRRGVPTRLPAAMRSGTLTVRFDNRDRRFDPTHATDPYFGKLKPKRRISPAWHT